MRNNTPIFAHILFYMSPTTLKMYFRLITICCFACIHQVRAQHSSINSSLADSLGHELEVAVTNQNAAEFFNIIDSTTFYNTVIAASTVAQNPEFMKGFLTSFSLRRFAGPLNDAAKKGSFRYLRNYEKGGNRHLLFRLMPGLGVNYYDLTLMRTHGVVRASDILFYVSGDPLSTLIINLIETMAPNMKDTADIRDLKTTVTRITALKAKGDWLGVKTEYEKLDKNIRQEKSIAMINVLACQHLGIDSYKQALEQYATDFPETTNGPLLMIDMYALNNEFDKALAAIDKLDSLTGGDPALDYLRAIQYVNMKKTALALECWLRVFAYDPSLPNNVKKLVTYYYNNNDTAKAQEILTGYLQTKDAKKDFVEELYNELPGLKPKN